MVVGVFSDEREPPEPARPKTPVRQQHYSSASAQQSPKTTIGGRKQKECYGKSAGTQSVVLK